MRPNGQSADRPLEPANRAKAWVAWQQATEEKEATMSHIDEAALLTLLDAASTYKEITDNDYGQPVVYKPRLTDDEGVPVITDPAEALKLVEVNQEIGNPPVIYVMVKDEANDLWQSSPFMTAQCARVLAISLLNAAMEMEEAEALLATMKAHHD